MLTQNIGMTIFWEALPIFTDAIRFAESSDAFVNLTFKKMIGVAEVLRF